MSREIEIVQIELRQATDRLKAARADPGLALYPTHEVEEKLAPFKAEVARLAKEYAQFSDRQAEAEEAITRAEQVEARRAAQEDAAFWFRRFFTTLGIANAGAFAAIASGFLQAAASDRLPVAKPVADAMACFFWGMIASGSIPLLLATLVQIQLIGARDGGARRIATASAAALNGAVFIVACASVACLLLGAAVAIGAVRGLVQH